MNFASKNLRYIRKKNKITQENFAQMMGIKRSLIGAYEENRADPKLEVVKRLATLYDYSFEQLMLQDIEKIESVESKSAVSDYIQERRKLKMAKEMSNIQFVPLKAAAGYLSSYADADFIDELNTFTLPMLKPGHYRAFEIEGDSMLPTPSGSVIIGEKLNAIEEVNNHNTYIVLTKNEGIVYKRLVKNEKKKNTISFNSDNDLFKPFSVHCKDILELWKAIYILHKPDMVGVMGQYQAPQLVDWIA